MYVEIILAALGVVSTVIGFKYGKRKNAAEAKDIEEGAKSTAIDNEIKLSEYYKKMLDDVAPRYQSRLKEFEQTVAVREKLYKEEIVLLRRKNKILESEIAVKNKRIKELESETRDNG